MIVRESQAAQFVYLGQYGDCFTPGKHSLVTDNIPVLTKLKGWKYGFEITSFLVENVSVPPEVEAAIDKRSSMSAIGNLNDYVKFQMAESMTKAGDGGAAAAMPAQMAMGFGIAQEMVKSMQAPPPGATAAATGMAAVLTPAQAAQALGVTEADVLASLDAGDLKGKKIGSAWRITKSALDAFLAE